MRIGSRVSHRRIVDQQFYGDIPDARSGKIRDIGAAFQQAKWIGLLNHLGRDRSVSHRSRHRQSRVGSPSVQQLHGLPNLVALRMLRAPEAGERQHGHSGYNVESSRLLRRAQRNFHQIFRTRIDVDACVRQKEQVSSASDYRGSIRQPYEGPPSYVRSAAPDELCRESAA